MKEPLSPEAKAVLDAVTFSRYDVPSEACPGSIEQIKADAAQVLFAAARQILEASPEWLGSEGAVWFQQRLRFIATELKNIR